MKSIRMGLETFIFMRNFSILFDFAASPKIFLLFHSTFNEIKIITTQSMSQFRPTCFLFCHERNKQIFKYRISSIKLKFFKSHKRLSIANITKKILPCPDFLSFNVDKDAVAITTRHAS